MAHLLPLTSRVKAALRQPKEESFFSIDINGKVHSDASQLKYFYIPEYFLNQNIELSTGYKDFVRKDESQPLHLNNFLEALITYEKKKQEKIKGDIITYRGIMTNLLCLPYSNNDDIDYNILAFDGQIFIEEDHHLKKQKERYMDEMQQIMCYWGYKFEGLATLDKPWPDTTRAEIDSRVSAPVNNIEQYCSIVRTGVGHVKTVLGGEVDCVFDYKPEETSGEDPLAHYVELKCTQVVRDDKDARKFERKIFKTWAQSFLLGVRKVIYGFRDENGVLKSFEHYDTSELPVLVKNSQFTTRQKWNGNDAIAFYAAVLEWIKTTIGTDESNAWRLEYKANSQSIQLRPLEGEAAEVVKKTLILPEFKQWRNELKKS
ncbi:decapping nuclease Rai1p [Trichomonascus vanleenenianus]|uniref:decapping nuclease n=1 Tax=Trichomonascus vanleenenianus TaxID=2268995 RepID=UPI003ECB0D96